MLPSNFSGENIVSSGIFWRRNILSKRVAIQNSCNGATKNLACYTIFFLNIPKLSSASK